MIRRQTFLALALAAFLSGCVSLPWKGEKSDEVNLVFRTERNLLVVDATVNGREGRFIVSSAQPRTILDTKFATNGRIRDASRVRIVLGKRVSAIVPVDTMSLGGIADGILGVDVWRRHTLTVDYAKQIVTVSTRHAHSSDLVMYHFSEVPTVPIVVDGRKYTAILDTASPDSVVLPVDRGGTPGRRNATVAIADRAIGPVDVLYTTSTAAHVGNRVLSRFLLFIDYAAGESGFWGDPRRPMLQP